jgi:hypothetical protein
MVEGVEKLVNDIVQQGKESTVSNVPHLEMEFESEALAYEFYNEYSRKCGFGIRREYANKSKKDGVLTSRKFVCSKEGRRGVDKRDYLTKEARAETRTGCLARMVISLDRKIGNEKKDQNVDTVDLGGAKAIKSRDCLDRTKKRHPTWLEKLDKKRQKRLSQTKRKKKLVNNSLLSF